MCGRRRHAKTCFLFCKVIVLNIIPGYFSIPVLGLKFSSWKGNTMFAIYNLIAKFCMVMVDNVK